MPNTPTNADRASLAQLALDKFAWATDMADEPEETVLCDLLANLMHHSGQETFDAALEMARMHYEAEIKEERNA